MITDVRTLHSEKSKVSV